MRGRWQPERPGCQLGISFCPAIAFRFRAGDRPVAQARVPGRRPPQGRCEACRSQPDRPVAGAGTGLPAKAGSRGRPGCQAELEAPVAGESEASVPVVAVGEGAAAGQPARPESSVVPESEPSVVPVAVGEVPVAGQPARPGWFVALFAERELSGEKLEPVLAAAGPGCAAAVPVEASGPAGGAQAVLVRACGCAKRQVLAAGRSEGSEDFWEALRVQGAVAFRVLNRGLNLDRDQSHYLRLLACRRV